MTIKLALAAVPVLTAGIGSLTTPGDRGAVPLDRVERSAVEQVSAEDVQPYPLPYDGNRNRYRYGGYSYTGYRYAGYSYVSFPYRDPGSDYRTPGDRYGGYRHRGYAYTSYRYGAYDRPGYRYRW